LEKDFCLTKKELIKLLKIANEKSIVTPSGLSRKERRKWANKNLNKV